MKRNAWRGLVLLLMVGVVWGWPPSARCETDRGWFLGGGGGVAHLDVEESVNPKPDLGFRLAASGGYQFNRNLALEFDTGYVRNTFTKSSRPSQREDKFHQVPFVLNGLFTFANSSAFDPFLGAGFGVVYEQWGDAQGGDVGLAFKGGVRYGMSERVSLGADYTFFMLGAVSAFIGEAVGIDTGNLTVRWTY